MASICPLKYIQDKLNNYGIKTQIYTENERKHRLMCTSFSEMNKLINCLYYEDGLFCLERKYKKNKTLFRLQRIEICVKIKIGKSVDAKP